MSTFVIPNKQRVLWLSSFYITQDTTGHINKGYKLVLIIYVNERFHSQSALLILGTFSLFKLKA